MFLYMLIISLQSEYDGLNMYLVSRFGTTQHVLSWTPGVDLAST